MMFAPRLAVCLAACAAFCAASNLLAQDITPPVVAVPLSDFTVAEGSAPTVVHLKKTFALSGVTGQVVRFSTVIGNIDVELDAVDAPQTVANFLTYVNNGAYNSSLIHRSVPGFIFQGGGYQVTAGPQITAIPTNPPVVNEFKVSNTRGTIAMAKLGSDPNSATSQWFFNEADNSSNLDNQNGGFTVFGRVIEGDLATMDAIAAVPVPSPSPFASPLDMIPLINYSASIGVQPSNLVVVNSIAPVLLTAKASNPTALLSLKVKANSNPGLVTATIKNSNLTLTYAPGATGAATITVLAKDSAKSKATTNFTVTVQ